MTLCIDVSNEPVVTSTVKMKTGDTPKLRYRTRLYGVTVALTQGFSPSSSGFPGQYHSANAPYSSSYTRCEVWEPSKKQRCFRNGGRWIAEHFNLLFKGLAQRLAVLGTWLVKEGQPGIKTKPDELRVKHNRG